MASLKGGWESLSPMCNPACLSVRLSIYCISCPPHLHVHLSGLPSGVHSSIHLSVCVCLFLCLSVCPLSVYVSVPAFSMFGGKRFNSALPHGISDAHSDDIYLLPWEKAANPLGTSWSHVKRTKHKWGTSIGRVEIFATRWIWLLKCTLKSCHSRV